MPDSIQRRRRLIRRLAYRFKSFGDFIWSSPPPYPWDVWGADSDNLQSEAGRLIVRAIVDGFLIINLTEKKRAALNSMSDHIYWALQEGDEIPGRYIALFEQICFMQNIGPDQRSSSYDLHLQAWDKDDPDLSLLEAHAFAEVQYERFEALFALSEMLKKPIPLVGTKSTSQKRPSENSLSTRKPKRIATQNLRVNHDALEVSFRNMKLSINSHADFHVINHLIQARGKVVPYIDLFKAIKPSELSSNVQKMPQAPQEIKDAIVHIRGAFTKAKCSYRIEAIRGVGYKLLSPDE
jgi:hypothetical protein